MSTAVQTSYGFGFPKGVAGGLFDLSAHDVTTRQAEGDGVAFGLGVVVGTNKGTDVKLPATGATSDDFEGVVVHNSVMVEKDMDNNVSINSKRTVGCLHFGKNVAFMYTKDPEKFSLEIPLPFYQYPLQVQKLETEIPCETRTAGLIIYYPLSMLLAYGI